jgi:ABC-type nitrate/sulfonate/bicarbonate transport system permease component
VSASAAAPRGAVSAWGRRRDRAGSVASQIAFALGLPVLVLVVWSIAASVAPTPFFPPPLEIGEAFLATWIGPVFVTDVLPSLGRLAIAVAVCIVLGVAAGVAIGSVRWLGDTLEPLLEFFRAVPPPVLIPIASILLGITDTMRVVVIVAGAIWPILINTVDGVRARDGVLTETARSFSIPRAQQIWSLVLPAAAPRILTGVRQSLSIALILMVVSEMFNSSSGLGFRIVYFQRNYLIAEMWSGILLLGLIGLVLASLFHVTERRMLRWYHGSKGTAHE